MPNRDGTGPLGREKITGRGRGNCAGPDERGYGRGRGRGRCREAGEFSGAGRSSRRKWIHAGM